MENSGIEWCDNSWNVWWGCTKVSRACDNCYAEMDAKRFGFDIWGPHKDRRELSERNWNLPFKWNWQAERRGERLRIFVNAYSDTFEDHPDADRLRPRMWTIIRKCPRLDFMLLTKRPGRIRKCLPDDWSEGYPNVWLGTTVEEQKWADIRVALLRQVPAQIRFLSVEPLLGPVTLDLTGIHWVIAGGESGPKARPMQLEWARSVRDQVKHAMVKFFFKQWGQFAPVDGRLTRFRSKKKAGRVLDGHEWLEFPRER